MGKMRKCRSNWLQMSRFLLGLAFCQYWVMQVVGRYMHYNKFPGSEFSAIDRCSETRSSSKQHLFYLFSFEIIYLFSFKILTNIGQIVGFNVLSWSFKHSAHIWYYTTSHISCNGLPWICRCLAPVGHWGAAAAWRVHWQPKKLSGWSRYVTVTVQVHCVLTVTCTQLAFTWSWNRNHWQNQCIKTFEQQKYQSTFRLHNFCSAYTTWNRHDFFGYLIHIDFSMR